MFTIVDTQTETRYIDVEYPTKEAAYRERAYLLQPYPTSDPWHKRLEIWPAEMTRPNTKGGRKRKFPPAEVGETVGAEFARLRERRTANALDDLLARYKKAKPPVRFRTEGQVALPNEALAGLSPLLNSIPPTSE